MEVVDRLHWNDWEPILEPLNAAGHEALGKGLVVAEETHHWCCGSVAAAIWVTVLFEKKFPEAADALADGCLLTAESLGALRPRPRLRPIDRRMPELA